MKKILGRAVRRGLGLAAALAALAALVALPHAHAMEFDPEEAFESVFVILSDDSIGSGFAIEEHRIITNAHVIEGATEVALRTYSGDRLIARVEYADAQLDLAILTVPDRSFTALKPADLEDARVGDDVFAVGAPNSFAFTLTKGILSSKDRRIGAYTYLQTDAAINTGNSGGPLLNSAGEVLGIATLKMSESEGVGFAIPITVVLEYVANAPYLGGGGAATGGIDAIDAASGADPAAPEQGNSPLVWIALGCSVALNVVLAVFCLATRRRRVPRKASDPSERTDFVIEVLE